jgi:hypothetical protein
VQLPGCRFIAEHVVNFPHDPLCPLHSRGYEIFCAWTRMAIVQIFSCLQVPSHKDSCHDCQHSFAALVHPDRIYISPYLRQASFPCSQGRKYPQSPCIVSQFFNCGKAVELKSDLHSDARPKMRRPQSAKRKPRYRPPP